MDSKLVNLKNGRQKKTKLLFTLPCAGFLSCFSKLLKKKKPKLSNTVYKLTGTAAGQDVRCKQWSELHSATLSETQLVAETCVQQPYFTGCGTEAVAYGSV